MAWVATAIVGSAAIGGIATAYSASKAADAQTNATNLASQTQLTLGQQSNKLLSDQYNQTRSDLEPYRGYGTTAGDSLINNLSQYTTPIPMSQDMLDLQKPLNIDQKTLETLPGYQFALKQGLKATQNSAAARGLGVSGAALKGAATFTQGLADSNYSNYFSQQQENVNNAFSRYNTTYQNQVANQGNAFNRLASLVNTGEGAAAQTSAIGNKAATTEAGVNTSVGNSVGSNTIGAGNANAAAYNTTGQSIANAANSIGGYAAYKGLYGPTSVQAAPNMSYVQGTAGSQYVPTYG